MKLLRMSITVISVGLTMLPNMYGCKSATDEPAPQQPVDSTQQHPAASKNSIDSVIGTYYGYTRTHEEEYNNGTTKQRHDFAGLDTVLVIRDGINGIKLESSRVWGVKTFQFDTSGVLNSYLNESTLLLFPSADSISYSFYHAAGTSQFGQKTTSSFAGHK